jgi:hypothetical protein
MLLLIASAVSPVLPILQPLYAPQKPTANECGLVHPWLGRSQSEWQISRLGAPFPSQHSDEVLDGMKRLFPFGPLF